MYYLITLLFLLSPPAIAGEPLCQLVDEELKWAVSYELITEEQRNEIYLRCLLTTGERPPAA